MKPEICAKQRFFDPYAYLVRVPNNTLKQLHRVDKTTGKNGHTQIIDPEHGALAFTSLGHSGLQTSLLSHIRDESEVSQRLSATDKILMLDVVIFSLNTWNPVYLRLISERRANFATGFVPSRLGAWRRTAHSDGTSPYIINASGLSFERQPIKISQVKNPKPYTGPPLRFAFRGQQSEALVSDILLTDPQDLLKSISRPEKSFLCRGAILVLQHSCTQCGPRIKIGVCFGGHGAIYRPWCLVYMAKVPEGDESPMRVLYRTFEQANYESIKYSSMSRATLPCKVAITAQIDLEADEDCYFIVLSSTWEETQVARESIM